MHIGIGEQLALFRRRQGLTQERAARRLNITRQALSQWELGKTLPDIYAIISLAKLYNISLDELLLGRIYFKGVQNVKPEIQEKYVKACIERHFPGAGSVELLNGGLVSQTVKFNYGRLPYIFQMGGGRDAYEKERYVFENFGEDLPLREVVLVEASEKEEWYSISRYIPGGKVNDLTRDELEDIVPEVMALLRRLREIALPENSGFGRFDQRGQTLYRSWPEFILSVLQPEVYRWDALKNKGYDTGIIDQGLGLIEGQKDLYSLEKPSLVHGDLGSYNLLADGGKISGIIDWSLSLFGDPLYDIANLLFWNEDCLQPLVKVIKEEYYSDEEVKTKLKCYMVRIALEEIYTIIGLNGIGYDVNWVTHRLKEILAGE